MIADLLWRAGCRLCEWALRLDDRGMSLRIDAQPIDWRAEAGLFADEIADMNPPNLPPYTLSFGSSVTTCTTPVIWN